ncbi:hypothetical protein PI23P_04387 [Polaribacter irgensii 23-P]|uniref:Glycosyltransferase 2-like domain-containing protein n=1 Tax=Polaribacter irgensii 23-P TaxID=313594 RepID=A4BXL4_9FLAO|nr:hypothetical protein [Polaribacter irgensii]EAR13705.1 hypothetical protein PI23P_04387 [Polaribacter irgensii 23-P]
MAANYVIDCAGNKVLSGDALFSSKCWVGNSSDYLEVNNKFIISEAVNWLHIPKVAILIPIYRSGTDFLGTLKTLSAQNWSQPQNVEIILSINQPLGPIDALTKASLKAAKTYIKANNLRSNTPQVRLIFERLAGGLAEVYQRSFSTLVARIRNSVNARKLKTKQENALAIGALMESTIFAIIDDDQILVNNNSLPAALEKLQAGTSVIMGQVKITKVTTSFPEWDAIIADIMNLFFKFKYEHGTAILTPRALMVSDLFHQPTLKIGEAYADQIWFAAAAAKKERLLVKVTTTLEHEVYPSNANMAANLAKFLASGTPKNAIDIFKKIRTAYKQSAEKLVYSVHDIEKLIASLETRNKKNIENLVQQMLQR